MVLLYYLRHILKPEIYGPGYLGMLRQGLTESPYLTISCMMFPFPLLIIPYIFWKDKKMDGTKKMYMLKYTIMRPNDPRLKYFNKHVIDRTKST
ncbi:hypothetical protein PGB90_005767 [Kerria lacca]